MVSPIVRQLLCTICLLVLPLAACEGPRPRPADLQLADSDDAAAAVMLRAALREAGVPVEAAGGAASFFVYRRGMATLLSPVLQSEGLDRIIATRSYAPATGRSTGELATLASTLNERLNVASFKHAGGALVMEANLTFLDRLTLAELLAFLDWLDDVELAIRRVDAESRVLLLTESGA